MEGLVDHGEGHPPGKDCIHQAGNDMLRPGKLYGVHPGEVPGLQVTGGFLVGGLGQLFSPGGKEFLRGIVYDQIPGTVRLFRRHTALGYSAQEAQADIIAAGKLLADQRCEAVKFRPLPGKGQLSPGKGLVHAVPAADRGQRVAERGTAQVGFLFIGLHTAGDDADLVQGMLVQPRVPLLAQLPDIRREGVRTVHTITSPMDIYR